MNRRISKCFNTWNIKKSKAKLKFMVLSHTDLKGTFGVHGLVFSSLLSIIRIVRRILIVKFYKIRNGWLCSY